MIRRNLFLLLIVLAVSCDDKKSDNTIESQSNENSLNAKIDSVIKSSTNIYDQILPSIVNVNIVPYETKIQGDFNGDGKTEFIKYSLQEFNQKVILPQRKIIELLVVDSLQQWIYNNRPTLNLFTSDSTMNKKTLINKGFSTGLHFIANIGNVYGGNGDEIAIVISNADYSMVNTCFIYTYLNDWIRISQFEIREWQFETGKSDNVINTVNGEVVVRTFNHESVPIDSVITFKKEIRPEYYGYTLSNIYEVFDMLQMPNYTSTSSVDGYINVKDSNSQDKRLLKGSIGIIETSEFDENHIGLITLLVDSTPEKWQTSTPPEEIIGFYTDNSSIRLWNGLHVGMKRVDFKQYNIQMEEKNPNILSFTTIDDWRYQVKLEKEIISSIRVIKNM